MGIVLAGFNQVHQVILLFIPVCAFFLVSLHVFLHGIRAGNLPAIVLHHHDELLLLRYGLLPLLIHLLFWAVHTHGSAD